jgi:hypothetical protein
MQHCLPDIDSREAAITTIAQVFHVPAWSVTVVRKRIQGW